MKVVLTRDPERFAYRAGEFLARRPIEHNVLATVVATLQASESQSPPLFAWVEEGSDGAVSAAVLRTLPRPLLASTMRSAAAEALVPALLEADPWLPGVAGVQPAVSYLAEAWRRLVGGPSKS